MTCCVRPPVDYNLGRGRRRQRSREIRTLAVEKDASSCAGLEEERGWVGARMDGLVWVLVRFRHSEETLREEREVQVI